MQDERTGNVLISLPPPPPGGRGEGRLLLSSTAVPISAFLVAMALYDSRELLS